MKNFIKPADLHTHSTYSDGTASIEEMVKSAIALGIKTIAITDHMPLPFPDACSMKIEVLEQYRQEINAIKKQYKEDIAVLMGIEVDYLRMFPDVNKTMMSMPWDYCIGSVHFFSFGKDGIPMVVDGSEGFQESLKLHSIGKLCEDYYTSIQQMVASYPVHTVGHFDVIKKFNNQEQYFSESSLWYRELVLQTLTVVQKAGVSLEINTAGRDKPCASQYPSTWIIEECVTRKIPLYLGSDSHSPTTIGQYFSEYNQYQS